MHQHRGRSHGQSASLGRAESDYSAHVPPTFQSADIVMSSPYAPFAKAVRRGPTPITQVNVRAPRASLGWRHAKAADEGGSTPARGATCTRCAATVVPVSVVLALKPRPATRPSAPTCGISLAGRGGTPGDCPTKKVCVYLPRTPADPGSAR
jgi:hypothetical protein